jgi:hypothetical protein
MNTEKLTQAIQTQSVSDAVKMAANNFLLIDVSVSFWSGVGQLNSAAEKAAIAAGAEATGTRIYKDLLGTWHSKLKIVNKHYRRLRTVLGEETIPYSKKAEGEGQRRGKKMVNVLRYPDVAANLADLKETAEVVLAEFLDNYDDYRAEALAANFGTWRSEAERLFPTAQEVASKFKIEISDPEPLPVFSDGQIGSWSLPAEMLGKIVEQSNAAIAQQLEAAKQESIDASLKVCETALKQLTEGERFSESILTNVEREAVKLREMADGYDNDPRIQEIADDMLSGIANVSSKEEWKNNETKKIAAAKSAATTVKNLKRMQQAAPVAVIPDTSGVILPELTADLI